MYQLINHPLFSLTLFDYSIFFFILLSTIILANFKTRQGKRQGQRSLEYFLMGRRLTFPFFVATTVATWYGGIFGVTSLTFQEGIYNFFTQGLSWYIAYFIFALFIIDRVVGRPAMTLPQLVHLHYGPHSAKVAAILGLMNCLPIAYLIGLGIFLQGLFGGDAFYLMLIGLGIILLYSHSKGFSAIVYSDTLQFCIMFIAVISIVIFSFLKWGGVDFLIQHLPRTHFEITGSQSPAVLLSWIMIALGSLVDPNFYQRFLAVKDVGTAKKGLYTCIIFWLIFDLCTTTGALYARSVYPQANPQQAYLIYAMNIVPTGLRGLILAGILATILSTIDSYLFLANSILYLDLLPEKIMNYFSPKITMCFLGLMSAFATLLFSQDIIHVWYTLGSIITASLLIPVTWGHFRPSKKEFHFLGSVLPTFILMIILNIFSVTLLPPLYVGLAFSAILSIVMRIGPYTSKAKAAP